MLKIITQPTVEPVTADEVRRQAVIGANIDSQMIDLLISAAREDCEAITGRSLGAQTVELVLDDFPSSTISLPRTPITEINSVKYIDTDGVEQTYEEANYDVDTGSMVGRIQPVSGTSWPETSDQLNAVRIRYKAGWTQESCPKAIKQWILLRVTDLYETRTSTDKGYEGLRVREMPRNFWMGLLDRHTVRDVL